jgi:quercetin dioxygenase-like cupin family protein
MSQEKVVFVASATPQPVVPEPGASRQVLAHNEKLMIVRNSFVKGWSGARHAHPHEQSVYVVKGHIHFEAEGKSWELHEGDSIVLAGDVPHQASAVEESVVLDIFTPFRQDFL